jgi:hypothetical protein
VKCSMWFGQPGGIHPTFPGFHVVCGAMIVPLWRLSNTYETSSNPTWTFRPKPPTNQTESLKDGREEDGWRGTPFWWPVLFAPAKAAPSVFASNISDAVSEEPDGGVD